VKSFSDRILTECIDFLFVMEIMGRAR
jgi:hypothetical protein